MFMLIFADHEDRIFYQKFSNEQDMNKFIDQRDDVVVLGSKVFN